METLFSIIFVYTFILLGFLAKYIFKDKIDAKSLSIVSVYFMQPFVALWGFSKTPLTKEHIWVVLVYWGIIFILLIPTIFIAKRVFTDPKERSIFTIAGFVGNTGNIGIPLGIALFKEASIVYTSLINLANVFVVYIVGVYIYSRGKFNIKESLKNIIKIPIIPAAMVAILLNLYGISFPAQIEKLLTLGAYSAIVLQLFLLGTFLESISIKKVNVKLYSLVLLQKFFLIPLATIIILSFVSLTPFEKKTIFMEMITPLAIANINLAALYDCKPKDVSNLIFLSTLLFIAVLLIFVYGLKIFF